MALRAWRIVEEELKKSGENNPMLLRSLGELYERRRVQHEQLQQIAAAYVTLVDKFNDMVMVTGRMDQRMDAAGLSKKIDELDGDPDETGSTHEMTRGDKH